MAVNIHNLDGFVFQTIESTGVSLAKHELGFTVRDRSTGKVYMYVQLNTGAGSVTAVVGAPVGIYHPADAAVSHTVVTNDQSDSVGKKPIGILRGIVTDLYYCFIEIIQKHLVTTVKVISTGEDDWEAVYLVWSADSVLTSSVLASATADPLLIVGKALDSDKGGNAWVYVQWL